MATKGIKSFDISGLKEIYKDLDLTAKEIENAALKGQKVLAQNILGESQKIVPRDTGTLARSGHIETKLNITTISYNTPYAIKQHEDDSLKHKEGQQAKYLEQPFNEKVQEYENYVQTEVYKALRKKNKS